MPTIPQSEIRQALNLPYGGQRKLASVMGTTPALLSLVFAGKRRLGPTLHERFTAITGYVIEWTHDKKRRYSPDWKA